MFRKISLAVATATTVLAGTMTLSTPASAHYTGYYHKHYYQPHCYWTYKSVKIYTYYGPRWVQRRVRVCY